MADCWDRWDKANEDVNEWIKEPEGFEIVRVLSDVERLRMAAIECMDDLRDRHVTSLNKLNDAFGEKGFLR